MCKNTWEIVFTDRELNIINDDHDKYILNNSEIIVVEITGLDITRLDITGLDITGVAATEKIKKQKVDQKNMNLNLNKKM